MIRFKNHWYLTLLIVAAIIVVAAKQTSMNVQASAAETPSVTPTATQGLPSPTPTITATPTLSVTPTSISTNILVATPRRIINLPIIMYQLAPIPTPTPRTTLVSTRTPVPLPRTATPTATNTTVPTNTPPPTPTPVPLFVGLNARWDGRGFVRIGEYHEPGWHWTMKFTERIDSDVIKSENYEWYEPNPLNFESHEWDSFYSVSSGSIKSSSLPGDPAFKWGFYRILPYRFDFEDGEIIEFIGQEFRVSGPHSGYGAFGQRITYWRLVNRETFLYWDGGDDVRQYVHPGDVNLEYDINTRLLLESDILRHYYVDGNLTPYTVQYIIYLTSSNAYPIPQIRFAPANFGDSSEFHPPSMSPDIPEESLLSGP